MCGIVFGDIKNGKRACKVIMKRYKKQSVRGKEGYGAVAVDRGVVKKIYRAELESGMQSIYQEQADVILFHHRRPTSTPNFVECTHPIAVINDMLKYNYLVVHNGVIHNAEALRTEFEKIGFQYTTAIQELYRSRYTNEERMTGKEKFNDSESLAIDLALAIEQGKPKTQAYGSIAFVAIQYNKENNEVNKVYFGRNAQSPLRIDMQGGNFILASEGQGIEVEVHQLYSYDLKTRKHTKERSFDVGYNYSNVGTYYNDKTKTTVQEVKDIPLLPQKSIPVAIKSLSVSFVNDDNTRSVFTLPVVGGCLEKTSIKDTYVEYMEKEDVVKYLDLLRKINTLATWEKDMQDFGVEYTKEDLNNTINRRIEAYKEIGMLSVKIKSRVTLSEK